MKIQEIFQGTFKLISIMAHADHTRSHCKNTQ